MFKKNLEGILRGFHGVMDDLKELTEQHKQEMQHHQEMLDHHDKKLDELTAENQKANSIIGNIEKLLALT